MKERISVGDGSSATRTVYAIEYLGKVVGMVTLGSRPFHFWRKSMWSDPDAPAVCVSDLAVLPNVQGRGLGRAAMEFAEARAKAWRLPYIRLDAFAADPRSNALYRKWGYEGRGELVVGGVVLAIYEKKVFAETPL